MGFTNPKIEYTDEQYQELKTYKEYSAFIRPIIQESNPKMAMSKVRERQLHDQNQRTDFELVVWGPF